MRTPVYLRVTIAAACLVSPVAASAQYVVEDLGRSVIALRVSDTTVYIGWRLLGTDPAGIAFNVYRTAGSAPPVKLNIAPITETTK